MNKKAYWIIRKKVQYLVFLIKKALYTLFFRSNTEKNSLNKSIVRSVFNILFHNLLLFFLLWEIDRILPACFKSIKLDTQIFSDVVICGLGIAGVILGLFCANISSVYASKYTNASKDILYAFQNDYAMQRCMTNIIQYLIFGLIIIVEIIVRTPVSYGTLVCFMVWTFYSIVSYIIVGRRIYELSNVYSVADDAFQIINHIITKNINKNLFKSDANFQTYFMRVCDEKISFLGEIEEFGRNSQADGEETVLEFACVNLNIIEEYWKIKRSIPDDSAWFKDKRSFTKWHSADSFMGLFQLRNGMGVHVKKERNHFWFEENVFEINKRILDRFEQNRDYQSLYKYAINLLSLYGVSIKAREVRFFSGQVDYFVSVCKRFMEKEDTEKNKYLELIYYVSALYLFLIINVDVYCHDLDLRKIWILSKSKFDDGKVDFNGLTSIYGQDFINKIAIEVQVFGKRITPDWVIKQKLAIAIHDYIGELLVEIKDGINVLFEFGNFLNAKGRYAGACIILARLYEFDSKCKHLFETIESVEAKLEGEIKYKPEKYDSNEVLEVKKTLNEWKGKVPLLLSDAAEKFAIDTWENREEYPDYLGECYTHICEDAVEAISNGNIVQFEMDYSILSRLMLFYKEYIRTDLIKDNTYRVGFVYYMGTVPIVEWAQVGGLAILYGEFRKNGEWLSTVYKHAKNIIGTNTGIAEEFVSYIQHRDKYMFGMYQRDILENEWKKMVEKAIRKGTSIKIKKDLYGECLDSDSDLLVAFCPDFPDEGFTSDPSEVFWVICMNPQLTKEKRFKSRDSWEEEIDVETYLARIVD